MTLLRIVIQLISVVGDSMVDYTTRLQLLEITYEKFTTVSKRTYLLRVVPSALHNSSHCFTFGSSGEDIQQSYYNSGDILLQVKRKVSSLFFLSSNTRLYRHKTSMNRLVKKG